VHAELVPHDEWKPLFRDQGMRHPQPRIRTLDGFNEGWIDFPENDRDVLKGRISAAEVIADLVERDVRKSHG
jgi:NAD(P)H dehydrogenase (quinone)